MALGCNCDTGLSNTGQPSCVTLQSVTSKIIQVPLIANDGTANKINLATAITNSTFTALVNNVDPSKRWYPLPNFENVELAKADTQFEEANSGRKAFLRQGIRSFAGELWATTGTPQFLGKLQGDRCVKFGIYIVDVNGNLIGSKVGNDLYPITVDNNSWDPKFMFATDTTINKIMLGFDFDRLFDESTMWMITASEGLIDFNSLNGLLDVNFSTPTQVSGVSINFNAFLSYGTAINPLKYVGALTGDWQMTNLTTGLVVVGTVTETAITGNYTGLFTMVVGNKYRLRVTKTGFSGDLLFTAI